MIEGSLRDSSTRAAVVVSSTSSASVVSPPQPPVTVDVDQRRLVSAQQSRTVEMSSTMSTTMSEFDSDPPTLQIRDHRRGR